MSEGSFCDAKTKIEYEQVTVKVPKLVMDFLRATHKDRNFTETNTIAALEYAITDHVRAQMESMSGLEYIDLFDLKPVFYKVLNDDRFKPEETE
jgi:hypothetical protein